MTDDELAAIRERNDDRRRWGLYGATSAVADCSKLFDEVVRLQDENAQMRKIVEVIGAEGKRISDCEVVLIPIPAMRLVHEILSKDGEKDE